MTNKEAIEILSNRLNTYYCTNEDLQAIDLAIKALEDVKALRLLLDWAIDCDFGYDNIPEEYEKYKEEIFDMWYTSDSPYTEGLIHIAKRVVENEI